MSPAPPQLRRLLPAVVLPKRSARIDRTRVLLADGARTTLHVATYDRSAFTPRVVAFEEPTQLASWCRRHGIRHAIVGGFFLRPAYMPLGHLQIGGEAIAHAPFDSPWDRMRACLHVDGGEISIARRGDLDRTRTGDLLQAGPLLVRDGVSVLDDHSDAEGFSAGASQFDSDITAGRYPRAALGIDGERLIAVACDGRTRRDSGMTLSELADIMVGLGATQALNLDGGGSASLVHHGRLRNRPREEHGVDILGGRPVVTAVVFDTL
jgi:Phosphodiester glycosidase